MPLGFLAKEYMHNIINNKIYLQASLTGLMTSDWDQDSCKRVKVIHCINCRYH